MPKRVRKPILPSKTLQSIKIPISSRRPKRMEEIRKVVNEEKVCRGPKPKGNPNFCEGPRGGYYYINSNKKKVYRKNNKKREKSPVY